MRKKIYNIIEPTKNITTIEKIYDIFMILVIIASLLPLTIKTHSTFYAILENVTTLIFIIDQIPYYFPCEDRPYCHFIFSIILE